MKKIIFLVLLAAGFMSVSQLSAQSLVEEAVLLRLDLPVAVKQQIKELVMEQAQLERELGADQKILQARLERMLINEDPDMNQVENILRESLSLKLKEEMGRITRTQEMRKLMGEEKWTLFLRTRAEIRSRIENRINDSRSAADRSSRTESSSPGSASSGGSAGSTGTAGRR